MSNLHIYYGGQSVPSGSHVISPALGTDFGSVPVGAAYVVHDFTLYNGSSPPVFVTDVQVPAGFEAEVSAPLPLELSQSQATLTIRMLTAQPGPKSGTVVLTLLNDSGLPDAPYTFDIAGTVVAPVPQCTQRTLLGVGT